MVYCRECSVEVEYVVDDAKDVRKGRPYDAIPQGVRGDRRVRCLVRGLYRFCIAKKCKDASARPKTK
jgi:hypothetical protein